MCECVRGGMGSGGRCRLACQHAGVCHIARAPIVEHLLGARVLRCNGAVSDRESGVARGGAHTRRLQRAGVPLRAPLARARSEGGQVTASSRLAAPAKPVSRSTSPLVHCCSRLHWWRACARRVGEGRECVLRVAARTPGRREREHERQRAGEDDGARLRALEAGGAGGGGGMNAGIGRGGPATTDATARAAELIGRGGAQQRQEQQPRCDPSAEKTLQQLQHPSPRCESADVSAEDAPAIAADGAVDDVLWGLFHEVGGWGVDDKAHAHLPHSSMSMTMLPSPTSAEVAAVEENEARLAGAAHYRGARAHANARGAASGSTDGTSAAESMRRVAFSMPPVTPSSEALEAMGAGQRRNHGQQWHMAQQASPSVAAQLVGALPTPNAPNTSPQSLLSQSKSAGAILASTSPESSPSSRRATPAKSVSTPRLSLPHAQLREDEHATEAGARAVGILLSGELAPQHRGRGFSAGAGTIEAVGSSPSPMYSGGNSAQDVHAFDGRVPLRSVASMPAEHYAGLDILRDLFDDAHQEHIGEGA